MKNGQFIVCLLLILSSVTVFEPLLISAQESGYNSSQSKESNSGNGNGVASFFNYIGWILGFIFYSWLTPVWIGYLIWRFWPRIVNYYRVRKAKKLGREEAVNTRPVEIPNVTFKDVILPEEVLQEVTEVVDFLKDPQDLVHYGIDPPKGVLLSGPPGCGKTLLARAIAGEAGVRFYAYCGSDFVNKFVGAGASTIRARFEEARNNTPCIVFIDEMDSLGRQREVSLGSQEYDHALNQLLSEIDGFRKTPGLVLLAATNRQDLLDAALMRPGRLDRQVVIDPPDIKTREAILKLHAKKKPLNHDVDLTILAKNTPGFSGADLENILNEAAIIARRRNKSKLHLPLIDNLVERRKIESCDIEKARHRVITGLDRKSAFVSDEERLIVAFHEAGHALVAKKVSGDKNSIDIVSIIPRGRALGVTIQAPKGDQRLFSREFLLNQISIFCGGRLAEEIRFGPMKITTGARDDIERAIDIAKQMVCELGMSSLGPLVFKKINASWGQPQTSERQERDIDREVRNIVKKQLEVARVIIEKDRLHLELLALALLTKEVLTNAEIDVLLEKGREALENLADSLTNLEVKKSILSHLTFWKS